MNTRCHPAPPRRSACPRIREDDTPRATRSSRRLRAPSWALGVALAVTLAAPTHAAADDVARHIDESLALCAAADNVAREDRMALLARGLDAAEAALALDDRSARAHFAVVCNLGKATGLAGIGFGTFGAVRRLQREIDATLALAPDDAEALAAKGALLIKLPRWLGGDREEAALWLRRALAIDPTNTTARTYLEDIGIASPPFVAPASGTALAR
jgi:hypothetical protein